MEYQVNVNTTCARNSTFVKWQDGVSMFGVRLAKEDQAEQVFITTGIETNKYLDYIYLELLVILSENKIKFTL